MTTEGWAGTGNVDPRRPEARSHRATHAANALSQPAGSQRVPDSYTAHQTNRLRADSPPTGSSEVGSAETSPGGTTAPTAESKPIPRDFPPVVYLPCAESVVDPNDARIDMRQTRDGRTALLAYSALDRLQHCCGEDQAWIVMPTAGLSQLQAAHPFELLLLDVEIPVEQRRGQK